MGVIGPDVGRLTWPTLDSCNSGFLLAPNITNIVLRKSLIKHKSSVYKKKKIHTEFPGCRLKGWRVGESIDVSVIMCSEQKYSVKL